MIEKKLGKIENVSIGYGGYDDAMFGVSFTLSSSSWGVGDFKGTWAFPPSKGASWKLKDQTMIWGDMCRYICKLLKEAKVNNISELKGKPVEVTFNNDQLESWRILTETI